ncbi:MAG TPA: hypothetical protein EYG73_11940 [Arcobacter sp.]|nr:hypothetical protein [Arcobacter sp.]
MVHSIKKDKNNAFLSGNFFKKYPNETVASFFSEEYIDYILRSLLTINNAAEADEIFLETFGTNLAMLLDNYEHIKGGSHKLFYNFSKNSNIFLEKNITSLWYQDEELKGVIVDNKEKLKYDAVVLATTATSASKLLEKNNKKLSDNLKKVRYFPVSMLVAKYEKDVFTNKLNGYIFPRNSIISNVGVYDLEKKNYVRYTFSGREARSVLNNNYSIEELIVLAEKEFTKHSSIELPKRIDVAGRVTKQSAYSLNHQEFLEDVKLNLIDSRNIYLAGDYLESTSIEGCYRSGVAVSKQILKDFESRGESENSNSETRKSII